MNHEKEICERKPRACLRTIFLEQFFISITENAENTFDNKKLFYVLNNRKGDVFRKHLLIVL